MKEIERAGIPTVLVTPMIAVAIQVGAPRIVRVGRIPHPLGNPDLPADREKQLRRAILETALETLTEQPGSPTVYEVRNALVV